MWEAGASVELEAHFEMNERSAGPAAALAAHYRLTAAEARVAQRLFGGLTYAEVAGELGVSYHTVSSHVKSIHRKTGATSNGKLLALMRTLSESG